MQAVDNEFVAVKKSYGRSDKARFFYNRAANKKAPAQRAGAFTILNESFMQTF